MSTKFEQLLDYLVNEEMDKANELFHEIVVEKSRSIYENLIAEEEDEEAEEGYEGEDESVEEDADEQDESVEESADDEQADESLELEDAYEMDEEDGFDQSDDDATGMFGKEIGADDEEDPEAGEKSEEEAIFDIKNAIEELEAAFAELEAAQGAEHGDMDMDSEFGDEEDGEEDEMEMMGMPMENRRLTREYVEKVGNDWDKNSQKTQGQYLGANTGESMPAPTEGKSPISSGSGKPTSGANAKNIGQGAVEGQSNTGTTPGKVNKGITPEKSEQYTGTDWETNSKPGGKAGVKNLSKVGATDKGEGKAVGAGTGPNSVTGSTNTTSPLKHIK
jgi:hypothetical protein